MRQEIGREDAGGSREGRPEPRPHTLGRGERVGSPSELPAATPAQSRVQIPRATHRQGIVRYR